MVQVWTGREVRALREGQRLSIREFAARVGVSERMVSRWEAGGESIRPRPINQEGLDSLLARASEDEKARFSAFLRRGSKPSSPISGGVSSTTLVKVNVGSPPPRVASSAVASVRSSRPDVLAMQSFRSADKQIGGGHLYGAVVKYLHSDVGPRLFGGDFDAESPAVSPPRPA